MIDRATLDKFAALELNWDGNGADPISPAAIETAKKVRTVPQVNGGLQIELQAGGRYLEIEINPDCTIGDGMAHEDGKYQHFGWEDK